MADPETPFARRPPSRAPYVVAALVLVLGLGGFLAWQFFSKPAAPRPAAPVPQPAAGVPAAAPPAGAAPAAAEASAIPSLLQALSAHPVYRACLSADEPARRWAQLTEGLAEGTVPVKLMACARPAGAFAVERKKGRIYASPRSFARYDALGEAAASLDARAVARAYQALHPALEAAYRALGYPQGSIDQATARVLGRIARTPLPSGEMELVEAGGTVYAYADQRLEALGDVEKQLLRTGPRNAAAIQAKAKEIGEALGISPAAPRR